MRSLSPPHSRLNQQGHAFTLLEVLVSAALLAVVAVLTTSVVNGISSAWTMQRGRVSSFEGARAGFELLTHRISQAVLNTYWDYDDPALPSRYQRKSDLHFTVGRASLLLPDVAGATGDAVFFIAPLGFTDSPTYKPLIRMLTGCGFYLSFGADDARPGFLGARIRDRWRFRLHQMIEPGEKLGVYSLPQGNAWFQSRVAQNSHPIVENAFGLILRTIYPTASAGSTPHYTYDSRDTAAPFSHHQLPPKLAVTLLVMDETSALRLADEYGETMPAITPKNPAAFTVEDDYATDLQKWEEELRERAINYRIFTSEIPIRGAKWSTDL